MSKASDRQVNVIGRQNGVIYLMGAKEMLLLFKQMKLPFLL